MMINSTRMYQEGGFLTYNPTPPIQRPQSIEPTGGAPQEDASNGKQINGIDKDILKELLGKGLTNDVVAFKQQVDSAYSQYQQLSSAERETSVGRRLRQIMAGDFSQINALMVNKQYFDKAIENVKNNYAEGEYAVTNNGMLVMNEKGQIGEVSFQEYANNPQAYQALTNAELMRQRINNPNLAFDSTSVVALGNAMGTGKLRERILDVVSKLGSYDGPGLNQGNGVQFGHAVVKAVASMMNSVQNGTLNESLKSNDENIAIATNAILNSLNNNERSMLFAKAAVSGAKTPDDFVKYAASMIGGLLNMNLNTQLTLTKGKDGADVSNGKNKPVGYYQRLFNLSGAEMKNGIRFNMGNAFDMTVAGVALGGFVEDGNKQIGPSMITDNKKLMGVMQDARAFTFGGTQLNAASLDSIMYDGSQVVAFRAPYKVVGGQKVFDASLAEKYYDAKKEIDSEKNRLNNRMPAELEAKILRKNGFNVRSLKEIPVTSFGSTYGYTYRGNIKGYDPNLVEDVPKDQQSRIKSIFEKQYRYGNKSASKGNETGRGDYSEWFATGEQDMVKGRIIFAFPDNAAALGRDVDGTDITSPLNTQGVNFYNGEGEAIHAAGNTNAANQWSSSKLK